MILDGIFYPAIHFGKVILSCMAEPSCSQYFLVNKRPLCLPLVLRSLKTLDLLSGEGALTH